MAGTLTISTLSDGTNSTSSTNCIQGSAKAWVNFNPNNPVVTNASFNVSSVTRTTTGAFTISFTNAMVDANYAACLSGRGPAGLSASFVENNDNVIRTTTQLAVYALVNVGTSDASTKYSVSIFR